MSQITRAHARQAHSRLSTHGRRHPLLNTDGRRHPLENSLTIFTLVVGLAAFVTGFVVTLHMLASWAGLAGLLVGLYAQMISATRQERMLIVTGIVASFVGLALGLAHGAFLP